MKVNKKILKIIIGIISILIIIFFIIFYFQNIIFNYSTKEPTLEVYIINDTNINESISIIIINQYDIEIFNKTIFIESNEIKYLGKLTNKEGSYTIYSFVDENRSKIDDTIKVKRNYASVNIYIENDEIIIYQRKI